MKIDRLSNISDIDETDPIAQLLNSNQYLDDIDDMMPPNLLLKHTSLPSLANVRKLDSFN